MSTLGLVQGGKDPRIFLTGGQSFLLRENDSSGLSLLDSTGAQIGQFVIGKGLDYRGAQYKMAPDVYCPDWANLESPEGTLARLTPDHIDVFLPPADPALLLFAAWTLRGSGSQFLGTNWIGE